MDSLLIDTDVISYLFKSDTRAELYRPHLHNKLPLVSFMTVAELRQWMLIRNWGNKRKLQMETHLLQYTLVPFDRALCQAWAEVRYEAFRQGRGIETSDAWIAATARLYQVPLVTNNRSHFDWLTNLVIISESA